MKKYVLIIFIPILSFFFDSLRAQVPAIEWQKCLGGSSNEAAFSVQQTNDGNFIVAGYSDSNNGDVTGNHGSDDYWIVKLDTSSNLLWQKSLGGNSIDQANSIKQTIDGGFIVAGFSYSNDGDVSGNHGADDFWIVKLDIEGNMMWQKSLGGSGDDGANCIQQTFDGGFIAAGWSTSNDGDVSGNHGLWDYWLVKLDSSGNLEWQKSFGGSENDMAYSVQQATDGGFIISGYSESSDGDVSGNHGSRDYWIVKTDASGNLLWQTFLGGSDYDEAHSVQQTKEGGFLIAGFTYSTNGDVSGNHGAYDFWVVKLDTAGNLEWQKTLGGSANDQSFFINKTFDGGSVVVGQSFSNNGDVSGNHGGYDNWVVKLDTAGNLEWQKTLGGSADDYGPYGIQQTDNGEYIVGGATLSNDDDVSGNHGGSVYGDCWIVKLSNDLGTGIGSVSSSQISIYPNPVEDNLIINLPISANEATIGVYDLQGRIITMPITFIASKAQLNTSTLPAGVYTIQFTDKKTGESGIRKFIKQ